MPVELICFNLKGHILGAEKKQIEKILTNKQPGRESFILETGERVQSLKSFIPLPEKKKNPSRNILFLKELRGASGFSVDHIMGSLKVKGPLKQPPENRPIRYVVQTGNGNLVPVLDLRYIIGRESPMSEDELVELVKYTGGQISGSGEEVFKEVSEQEVYRSIDEEISKKKKHYSADAVFHSEKSGAVLPLAVNIMVVVFFCAGIIYYMMAQREKIQRMGTEGEVSGVEEEVIKEVTRRSRQEVEEQKQRLDQAKNKLEQLENQRQEFLQNQNRILRQREKALMEEYQQKLQEIRKDIIASGVENPDQVFQREKDRLHQEYLSQKNQLEREIEKIKQEYEEKLVERENQIRQEVTSYRQKISRIQSRLAEQEAELKKTELEFQSVLAKNQEYINFRRQLAHRYNRAVGNFTAGSFQKGIDQLQSILPVIDQAEQNGLGEPETLDVEKKLVKTLIDLAEKEQNRIDLNSISRKAFQTATRLEKMGKPQQALSRYYTAYTVATDTSLKNTSYSRAQKVLTGIIEDYSQSQLQKWEQNSRELYQKAIELKNQGQYEEALHNLETLISNFPGTSKSKTALDEIIAIHNIQAQEQTEEKQKRLNREALELLETARKSLQQGHVSKAISRYEQVVKDYGNTRHAGQAMEEVMDINKLMEEMEVSPSVALKDKEKKSGVIIQNLSGDFVLSSLGEAHGVKEGSILRVYRKKDDMLNFVGSIKVQQTYPTTSRGRIMYFKDQFKIGDVVIF